MEDQHDSLIYLTAGPGAALLLGMLMIPLRELTTASNLTFAFMALTIVIAEFGGRRAAVVTALASAISLDFFLTKPYMRLTIAEKHDVIAFVGLTVCGLLAAAFGSQRGQRIVDLTAARRHLDLLHNALSQVTEGGPVEPALRYVLGAAQAALPLAAAVIRDTRDHVVATSDARPAGPAPTHILRSDALLPPEVFAEELPGRGLPLPVDGGRLAIMLRKGQVGWLDVWGTGASASAEARRTLSDVGRLASVALADAGGATKSSG